MSNLAECGSTVCHARVDIDNRATVTVPHGLSPHTQTYYHSTCYDPWREAVGYGAGVPVSEVPCGVTVGPVPKLDGAVFTCVKHVFHAGDHESKDGTWWAAPYAVEVDPVNAPAHYRWLPNGIEVIDITETLGFCMGNAVKYILRADHKGKPEEDIRKSIWYLQRELSRRSVTMATENSKGNQ